MGKRKKSKSKKRNQEDSQEDLPEVSASEEESEDEGQEWTMRMRILVMNVRGLWRIRNTMARAADAHAAFEDEAECKKIHAAILKEGLLEAKN